MTDIKMTRMQVLKLHKWNVSYKKAAELQRIYASRISFTPLKRLPELVAGLDCAFSRDGKRIAACVVVMRLADFSVVEIQSAWRKVNFPYIPGLLSFREGPVCIAAVKKLKTVPDAFLVDGQGIAHPRRLGIAAHLGLFLDIATIGCAKSRLTGTYKEPRREKGSYSLLKDKTETIGAVVRTSTGVKPVFVSVGNKCRLSDAIKLTLACSTKYRLPEPARLAHQMVTKHKAQQCLQQA